MKKNSYSYDELINCGEGKLFGPGNAKLPLPPMLMFDRITEINDDKGAFKKGSLKAELDIKKNLWFFFRLEWKSWKRKGFRCGYSEIYWRSFAKYKISKISD